MTDEKEVFAVAVEFCVNTVWSRAYIFKSHRSFKKDEVVVVPVPGFWAVGRVMKVYQDYPYKPGIKYSWICGVLEDLLEKEGCDGS
jgi:hypothetical protein